MSDSKLDILKQKPIAAWDYPRIVVGVLQEKAMSFAEHVFYQYWAIATSIISTQPTSSSGLPPSQHHPAACAVGAGETGGPGCQRVELPQSGTI
jgi:hypothetical protein